MEDNERVADELRQMLLRAGAEPRDLTPLPGQPERIDRALERALATAKDPASERGGASRSQRRRPVRAVAAGLVAAAAAAVVVSLVLDGGTHPPAAQAGTPPMLSYELAPDGDIATEGQAAGRELRALAEARATTTAPASGEVQHVSAVGWWATTLDEGGSQDPTTSLVPVRSDSYFFPDATMRVIERRGLPLTTDGRIDDSIPAPDGPIVSDDSFTSADPGPDYAAHLPTTADALRSRLTRDDDPQLCARFQAACLVNDLIDLHRSYVVPPAVDAAFWDVLADEEDISYLGATIDRLGREALAFTVPSSDRVSQIVVFAAPDSGAFLGDELVLVKPSDAYSFQPPAVTSFTALTSDLVERQSVPPVSRDTSATDRR